MRQQTELKSREVGLDENSTFARGQVPAKGLGQALQGRISADDAAGGGTCLPPRGIAAILATDALEESDHSMQLAPGQQLADERMPGAESFQEVIINRVALLQPYPAGRLQEIPDLSCRKRD